MSQLHGDFAASIKDFEFYPENLTHQTTSYGSLKAYKTWLDASEEKLFTQEACGTNVVFYDSMNSGAAFDGVEIFDDEELQQRLGEASKTVPNGTVSRGDPKCRFIFIWAENSQAPLKTTRRMLIRMLTYHQVMPGYIDFLQFDPPKYALDDLHGGFKIQHQLKYTPSLAVDYLGRSGHQFQLCYNLRSVGRTDSSHLAPSHALWSFRQGAFHHQFDLIKGTALWMITRADLDLRKRIEETTSMVGMDEDRQFETPDQCLKFSLATHLLLCQWASENWRTYFLWLEGTVEDETYLRVQNRRIHPEYEQIYSNGDLPAVQILKMETKMASKVLEGNIGVFSALRSFYHELGGNDQFLLRDSCMEDISSFTDQIDSFIDESKAYSARGQLIAKILAARETIILQHFQNQATEKTERLTTSMQRHSVTVRIIAFLTFIYLPATFASTIFSTDVSDCRNSSSISTSDASGSTKQVMSLSPIAMSHRLQVTLPLTFLTFAAAVLWLCREDRKLRKVYKDSNHCVDKAGKLSKK